MVQSPGARARLDSEPYTMLEAQGPLPLDIALGKLRRSGKGVVSPTRLERIEAELLALGQNDRPASTDVLFRTPENH